METWGNWTFSEENENLLADVLNKFSSDQCSLDTSKKVVLSALATTSKTGRTVETSSSSSDDSDIDNDFIAVQTFFPKLCCTDAIEAAPVDLPQKPDNAVPAEKFDGESSFLLSQPDILAKDHENTIKLIIELLNAGDYDVQELVSLLKTEQRDRKNVSEIIGEAWPEMVTDKARHGLCEALAKTDVKPQVICELIYLPWFKMCESNLTGFIESLSNVIIHFPEYACKSFLVRLLADKESVLVKHVDWLVEIMKNLDQQHWCTLLNEYMKLCDVLAHHQIPVMLHLVKNCQNGLSDNDVERLVWLCRNATSQHCANRDFAVFLVSVISAIDLNKFRSEMTAICAQLKGASKFLITKALKDTK